MRKKLVSLLLALVMVLSLVPVTAFAAEGDADGGDTSAENGMVLTKTAHLEADGTYTINLEAFATGTTTVTSTTVATPLDVVVIVDQSGSMNGKVDDLQTAVTSFVNTIKEDAESNGVNHRVALVGFASGDEDASPSEANYHFQNTEIFIGSDQYNYAGSSGHDSTENAAASTVYSSAFQDVTTTAGQNNLTASINAFTYGGATFPQYAFEMTNGIFGANSNVETKEDGTKVTRKRIVVFFTDGEPKKSSSDDFRTTEANATIAKAYITKNTYGAAVYSVGLYSIEDDTNITNFMNLVSSNYPTADSMSDLDGNTVYNPVYSGDLDTSSVYYVQNGNSYRAVQYGEISSETTYTAITGDPDTSKTYYVYSDLLSRYLPVQYKNGSWSTFAGAVDPSSRIFYEATTVTTTGWYYQNGSRRTQYTPKTSADDTTNTQFYQQAIEGGLTASSAKYYMTTSDSSELEKIFETISQDVISSGTTVTLTEKAVMRDIMTPGAFQLPEGFTAASSITVKTQVVTTTDDATYTPGDVTTYTSNGDGTFTSGENTITVTANTETDTVDVTGFDYAENFVSTGHLGNKIIITIKGVEATEAAATGETVYTNSNMSGIYEDGEKVTPIVAFPTPDTIIPNKSYVIDYAKPFGIDAAADWASTGVTHLASSMAKFTTPATELDLTNGKVSAFGTTLTYTPQTMNWKGYDKFFSFGTQSGGLYQWSKVNVIPANNVYYEDDFTSIEKTPASTTTDGETTADSSSVQIVYNGNNEITTEKADGDNVNTEKAEGSETGTGATVHGWETSLADDTDFSDGSATKLTTGAKAKFTFTGTGVDIYSYTDMETGVVTASLYGQNGEEVTRKYLMVDHLAVSGEYFQIPTLSFQDLAHGTYTVNLVVNSANAPEVDENGNVVTETVTDEDGNTSEQIVYSDTAKRSTYYLDGIRIYNPVQNIENTDDTVKDAYTEEDAQGNITSTELNAVFAEVRDLMAKDTASDSGQGTVFIDLDGNGVVADKGAYDTTEYGTYGPKNEVYLAEGQSITFKVDGTSSNFYQVGLKAPEGTATTAAFSKDAETNSGTTINHSTDLYYKVTPVDGYITIKNTGAGLLSVTKIKMTGTEASGIALLSVTADEASAEIAAFSLRSVAAYDAAPEEEVPETPETPEEPETPEIPETPEEPEEPTEPEVPDIDIEIENPEPKPEEKPVQKPDHHENLKKLVNSLFKMMSGWFGR